MIFEAYSSLKNSDPRPFFSIILSSIVKHDTQVSILGDFHLDVYAALKLSVLINFDDIFMWESLEQFSLFFETLDFAGSNIDLRDNLI